jgi:GDP-L-fucose synthase
MKVWHGENHMTGLKDKKILLTGGGGFLGSYVIGELLHHGIDKSQIFIPRRSEFDLRKMVDCQNVVKDQDIVIHLAAGVGGIGYNREHPAELFYDNLMMGTQLMESARLAGVKKFVAIGTICAYPKFTTVPFKESELWNGYPEETNAPYGLAKKMMLVQAQAYRDQYGFNAIYLLPVNLYGPRDNFNPDSSHVIPALIKKFVEAKELGAQEVTVWGTGKATREFCHAKDAARGIVLATMKYDGREPVNIGSGNEISIFDLANLVKEAVGFNGNIVWDAEKPDGQPRRCLDVSLAKDLFGFEASVNFKDGIKETVEWYRSNQN